MGKLRYSILESAILPKRVKLLLNLTKLTYKMMCLDKCKPSLNMVRKNYHSK